MIQPPSEHPFVEGASLALRLLVFLLLLLALLAVPESVLIAAWDQRNGAGREAILRLPWFAWVLWGVFALWVALDAPRFLRMIKQEVLSTDTKALLLTLVGVMNAMAAVAAILST